MILDDYFIFGEKSSQEYSIHVEKFPPIKMPARRIREVSVAGRNGCLHIDEGTYDGYVQRYEIYFHDSCRPSPEMAHEIKSWLLSGEVVRRLEDSYDPEHYHLAAFKGPGNIENTLNEYGRCVIEFSCQPEAYLRWVTPIRMETPENITNPQAFASRPIITVFGSGTGELFVAGRSVEFVQPIEQSIIIDSDQMAAYRLTGEGAPEPKNNAVHCIEYPLLQPGPNAISWTGGITGVEIEPRWWEL